MAIAKSILGVHHVTAVNKNRFKGTILPKTAGPCGLIRASLRALFYEVRKFAKFVNYTVQ